MESESYSLRRENNELISDEKKEEINADKFGKSVRMFEENMRQWRKETTAILEK